MAVPSFVVSEFKGHSMVESLGKRLSIYVHVYV